MVTRHGSGEPDELDCHAVVAALGFTAEPRPAARWGCDIVDRHVVVDSTMRDRPAAACSRPATSPTTPARCG